MTAAAETPVKPFSAARGLTYLGGFLAYGLSLSTLYATTGIGLPCPFRWLTGWECPLCGGTRLGGALLHRDFVAAFAFNPVVFLGLIVVGVLTLLWSVEVLGGPRFRPPAALTRRVRQVTPNQWLVAGLAFAVIYTLLRNLL